MHKKAHLIGPFKNLMWVSLELFLSFGSFYSDSSRQSTLEAVAGMM